MFMDEIKNCTPKVDEYIKNRKSYDIKGDGPLVEKYRGSQIEEGVYASARDLGNYAAGYVAGKNGYTWYLTKFIFERYQATENGKYPFNIFKLGKEPLTTSKSEKLGWANGRVDLIKKFIK
jgi:bifunctional ADP-heptose synthase (sugar kinase/adenylyltransferase)